LAAALGALSLAADASNGFPSEKVLRTVLIASATARALGIEPAVARVAWWLPLLRYLGCTAYAHEEAHRYGAGDDNAVRNTMVLADVAAPLRTAWSVVRAVGVGAPLPERAAAVARLLGDGVAVDAHARACTEAATALSTIAGFDAQFTEPIPHLEERWDGRGAPEGRRGEAVHLAVRVHHVADVAEVVWHRYGAAAAAREVQTRAGGQLDPSVCAAFAAVWPDVAPRLALGSVWEAFLADEPLPRLLIGEGRLDGVCRAFAHFADLKSVYTLGHSFGVARLADKASAILGLPPEARRDLRRAAWLHDVGRVAVPNAVWDKPGALGHQEWEAVRSHAWWTERILRSSPVLGPIAALAAGAHERESGDGYHRGLPRAALTTAARVLAAADVRQALGEPRPHRAAYAPHEAAVIVGEAVAAGRLDAEAARAMLMAAGDRDDQVRPPAPDGLSEREVEVLVHVARGRSNKEIAQVLGLSPKTVQHHVAHVYAKIGVSARAAAALYAVERGLVSSA
jgi:HD-GYP domain-containing protein (c-di-GMP phosphodiesterase class II)